MLFRSLDAIFTDIYPNAVKIGMVSEGGLIRTIAAKLRQYEAKNIVVDPVMVATSGARLISEEAVETLKKRAFPAGLHPDTEYSGNRSPHRDGSEDHRGYD